MNVKKCVVGVLAIVVLLSPRPIGAAGWELQIFEWGPLKVALEAGVKVGFRSSIIGRILSGVMLADAVLGLFAAEPSYGSDYSGFLLRSGSGSDSKSGSSLSPPPPPTQVAATVSISPHDIMKGDVFSLKFTHLIEDGRIALPQGAYLTVEKDGRLVFHNLGFEGHMFYHYDKALSVWKVGGQQPLLLLRMGEDGRLEVLQEQSEEADQLLRKLLGG